MLEKPKCSGCLYWEREVRGTVTTDKGVCTGGIPQLGPNGYGYWPMTKETEGCWSGKPKEEKKLLTEEKAIFRPLDEQ